jgi:hypothetical protein
VRSILQDNEEVLNKALAVLAVENTLFEVGPLAHETVVSMLNKEYHCGLTDCYEHPEYLSVILKKLYGDSCIDIVESIREQLEKFSHKKSIGIFVKTINKQSF